MALRDSVVALVPAAPWVVFGAGALLGWRFRRRQLVLALLVLFAAERALAALGGPPGGAAGGTARVVFTALALLVPLDLAALAWLTERALGVWVWGALAAEPLAIVLLCRPELAHVASALGGAVPGTPGDPGRVLSDPVLAAFALALVLTVARFLWRQTIIHSSFVWAVGAVFLAFAEGGGPGAGLYLVAGGLVLVVSLVETSHRMAYVDELTGLPGRRALDEALGRLGGRYAIAMADIDHFKRFNDEHGHDAGDQLLRKVGAALERIEGGGRAYRYGGEEFAVLFPGKAVEQALPHLEAFRKTIERSSFTLRGGDRPEKKPQRPPAAPGRRRIAVTVSIGVAGAGRNDRTPEEVLRAADQALYRAKNAGRNRTYRAG